MELTYKTSSPTGDLLSLLPSMRQLYITTGKKAKIYQALNVIGQGLPNIPQPYLNKDGESIMMGAEMFRMLKPLLIDQFYIDDFIEYSGQPVEYDLDEIRLKTFTNQPNGSINRWAFYVFPEMATDLSLEWLSAPTLLNGKDYENKVIINFTSRYRNHWINYFFLKDFQNQLLFAGLPKEHADFCEKWKVEIPYLKFDNFYELAGMMNYCKFFMGNASMMFQIAEGLKINRLLETFQVVPNVIPMGEKGFDFYHQKALEYYFYKLIS